MEPFSASAVRAAYDAVAAEYADAFGDDLAGLPIDRAMLEVAVAAADRSGWVIEVGCGPAAAATYLSDRTPRVVGFDLSARMVEVAAARNPALRVVQADMRDLPLRARCGALIIAYYSVQHLPRSDLAAALAEMGRVLDRGGLLLVATHLGDGDVYIDEFLGRHVSTLGGAFYRRDELIGCLTASGFQILEERQRSARPHEHPSERIYVLARSTR